MTDKQIIIDSVDVSGCECFYINDSHPERKECINPYCKGLCKDNLNCYYKRLKRKEQEIKEICKVFDIEYAIDEETGNLIGRCNKLYKKEQECEKLKKRLESFQKDYSKLYQVVENKGYIKELDQLKAELEQLKTNKG